MNKKTIIIVVIITTIILSGVGVFIFKDNIFKNNKEKSLSDDINNLINSSNEMSGGEESAGSSIDVLRKRYTIQGVVLKGDYYLNNNQPLFALTKYLQALKSSPNDEKVKLKIADTYFELKKWSKAWEFYKNLTNNPKVSIDKVILSSIYASTLDNSKNANEIINSISSLKIDKEQKFYYINSINCAIDFHKCKRAFEDYVGKNEVKTKEMSSIKRALDNYKNFATEKVYYKDSLLAGAFYEMKLYPITIKISKDILTTMPNYRPIQLILGKSYFELGDNYSAKKQLEEYYTLNPNDAKIAYLLGIINFNLQDYAGSNMYYNNAIKNLYKPKIDLERRLAYNYYLLKEDKKMLSIFYSLLKEPDVEMTDFSLGIYNAIMLGETTLAQIWIKKAMEKYPKEEVFYGYNGWIFRESGDLPRAREELEKGLKINPRNPMITLNMAYLLEREGKYPMALIYAKKTMLANEGGEFGTLAEKEIANLNKLINANK